MVWKPSLWRLKKWRLEAESRESVQLESRRIPGRAFGRFLLNQKVRQNKLLQSDCRGLFERGMGMEERTKYFVLKQKAVPEVLLKVVEAKRLLESEKAMTVQEASDRVGISRSSFYKYKDDIFPFQDNAKGRTITLVLQMDDERGLLSDILHIVAVYKANILTIHQSIPVGNLASLTLSVEVRPDTGDISRMVEEMEAKQGIHYVKIIARE